jgi:hypothetical protein
LLDLTGNGFACNHNIEYVVGWEAYFLPRGRHQGAVAAAPEDSVVIFE